MKPHENLDPLVIAGKPYASRLLVGTVTGGYEPADPACGILWGQAVPDEITLTDEEKKALDHSAGAVKELVEKLKTAA